MADNEIMIVDERSLKDRIYIVRGIQVMFDFDLAEIYGYETKSLNQQARRNSEKFPADFRFQITREELDNLVRSQKVTSQANFSQGGQEESDTCRGVIRSLEYICS